MHTILTIYGPYAFKRHLLPAINDADYAVHLSKGLYNLDTDLSLLLEVVNGWWAFVQSEDYDIIAADGRSVFPHRRSFEQLFVSGEAIFQLVRAGHRAGTIIIRMEERSFAAYEHYRLPTSGEGIGIGRGSNNIISYNMNGENLLSSSHAVLMYAGNAWHIRDLGSVNGTFVNNRRIHDAQRLSFGDCIDLFGLRIVYLGDEIAVNVLESGAVVRDGALRWANPASRRLQKPNTRSLEQVFHRAPRQQATLDEDTVVIDEAPAPRDTGRNNTVLGAIGSSIAMALPMLLGCAFMLYASSVSGMGSNVFMLVGVVTAVASAFIGTVRSLVSIRNARVEQVEYENMRNKKYGEYLRECEQLIRSKYEKNTKILRERYQPAQVACTYDTANPELWSKNVSQPDFLTHRLGLGNMPFQVTVKTPARKFTLTDNALAELPEQIRATYATLKGVPVCVDLVQEKLVGVVGGRNMEGGVRVVRNLVAQIAANNSYTEVKLVFVYDAEKQASEDLWGYTRWLPHVWNETKSFRYVASGAEEASDVFFELNKLMRNRAEEASTGQDGVVANPYYVLVMVSPELLEGELMAKYALSPTDELGLTTIYLAERYEDLPNECSFVIQNDHEFQGMYHVTDNLDERVGIEFDKLHAHEAVAQAQRLANVRVVEPQTGGEVPASVSFFEMLGIRKPEDLGVLNRWRKNRTYESMRAMVGLRAGGAPCYLDIHEKYHGPHGLVAGTTGSGKSETLQTFILSLALNFSPDDVGFFVIDYKGGGMANLLEGLPHLIGQISNLSGNQVNRALVSIQSEKNRREAIFQEYGVKDIRDYTKLVKSGEATVPVPHLIIVIDEFAELKHDEPEFIDEIVSVSRVGRSLGIHLIMATQRPAGAVSEDIWANSRFKLCLRVQSKQDSMDMLRRPDAAYLTQSGRTYLQVGNDELFELFQSGYSGATYVADDADAHTAIATMLTTTGSPSLVGNHMQIKRQRRRKRAWIERLLGCVRDCGVRDPNMLRSYAYADLEALAERVYDRLEALGEDYPRNDFNTEALVALLEQVGNKGYAVDAIVAVDDEAGNKVRLPQRPERTQLEATVAYLAQLARDNGYDRDYSLFLPLLPERIAVPALPQLTLPWNPGTIFDGKRWAQSARPSLAVGMGLYDDPLNQRQDTFVLDLLRDGNVSVFGAPQTGKSTLLQTLVFSLLMRYSPAEVNVYAIEFSARRFSPFEQAPHVGGIVRDNDDRDKLDKLFTMLHRMREARKQLLGEVTYRQYVTSHGAGSLPAVVLVVDNYASLAQRTGDKYQPFLRNLTKEGVSYGMFVVASAAGVGSGELPSQMAQNFRTVVCLELAGSYDYATFMRRPHMRIRPETGVAGRGIAVINDRPLEFQTALPYAIEDELDLSNQLRSLAGIMSDSWDGARSQPIPQIPDNPTWDDFVALDAVRSMFANTELLPMGWDARLAEPCGVDLTDTYVYLVSGGKRKGKTCALRTLALNAREKGGRVVVVDFGNGSKRFCDLFGLEHIANEAEFSAFLEGLMPTIVERNQAKAALVNEGMDDGEVYDAMKRFERISILVDGLPEFVERAYAPQVEVEKTYEEFLGTVVEKCTLHNIFWFCTINRNDQASASSRQLYQEFVRDHKGIHLGGQAYSMAAGGLVFDNHDRRLVDNPRPVGVAMLSMACESTTTEAVLPLAKVVRT